jgi:hypothetical protein
MKMCTPFGETWSMRAAAASGEDFRRAAIFRKWRHPRTSHSCWGGVVKILQMYCDKLTIAIKLAVLVFRFARLQYQGIG